MLRTIAFVPSAPLLLPSLGGGPAELRQAVDVAVGELTGRVVAVGEAPVTGLLSGVVDATGFGVAGEPSPNALPLALAVGASLAGRAALFGIGPGVDPVAVGAGLVADSLLVVGDGTAKRTEKAPGHLDPRAEPFDRDVEEALAAGDPRRLLALDPGLAADLWVGGLRAWQVAAGAAGAGEWEGRVHYAAAPYGVGYVVGVWQRV
ncbi:MAG: hypothetical protein WCD35_10825 [Mycobacteriales bacterium]